MYEIKVKTREPKSTLDPSVARLIRGLALALQSHHLGLTTMVPLARTYERDQSLLNQAEDFLMITEGKLQPWRIREGL